jgi:hypothetical protein
MWSVCEHDWESFRDGVMDKRETYDIVRNFEFLRLWS